MSKYTFLLLAGLFVAVLPHLGFPTLWDTVMYALAGISIATVSVLARAQFKKGGKERIVEKQPVYVESTPMQPRRLRQPRPKAPKVAPQVDVVPAPSPSTQSSSPVNMAE